MVRGNDISTPYSLNCLNITISTTESILGIISMVHSVTAPVVAQWSTKNTSGHNGLGETNVLLRSTVANRQPHLMFTI